MNFLQLTKINIKRMLKDPLKLVFFVLLPIGMVFFTTAIGRGDNLDSISGNAVIAFNINDCGDLFHLLCSEAWRAQQIVENDLQSALELLENNEVAVVYDIPEDFTEKILEYEKPIITAYKRRGGNVVLPVEAEINDRINKLIQARMLIDKGIIKTEDELDVMQIKTVLEQGEKRVSGDMHGATMVLITFIIVGSVTTVNDLVEYRKKNILARAVTTPNSSPAILGSFILAPLAFQVSANFLIVILAFKSLGFGIVSWPTILVNLALASLFSITLSLLMVRIFKNETICTLGTALVSLSTLLLSMFTQRDVYPNIPLFISNLGKFTPQYWIFDSLERTALFPNALIALLMILAVFSAGCYKLRNFVQ